LLNMPPDQTIPLLVILEARFEFDLGSEGIDVDERLTSSAASVLEIGVRDLISLVEGDATPSLQNHQIVRTITVPNIVSKTGECAKSYSLICTNCLGLSVPVQQLSSMWCEKITDDPVYLRRTPSSLLEMAVDSVRLSLEWVDRQRAIYIAIAVLDSSTEGIAKFRSGFLISSHSCSFAGHGTGHPRLVCLSEERHRPADTSTLVHRQLRPQRAWLSPVSYHHHRVL
jgi:hypothetical protein